jgi:hypothetical protein
MKYNKEFKQLLVTDEVIRNLPDASSVLLSYDKWKQRIKRPGVHFTLNWRLFLTRECADVDKAIFDFDKRLCSGRGMGMGMCMGWIGGLLKTLGCMGCTGCMGCMGCMNDESRGLSDDEKARLCDLNKRTMYKICKKIDKRLLKKGSAARSFYAKSVSQQAFRFLGGTDLVHIQIQKHKPECPVCFDVLTTDCVVTKCCHAFCKGCAERMWADSSKKMLCPICRSPCP